MNLLLDTHVLLWWLDDSPELSASAREAIADGRNLVTVSAVSTWEIVIKEALGKLTIPDGFAEVLAKELFLKLDVTTEHTFKVRSLPMHHRDPFDRMLVAQALQEGLTLVTRDGMLRRYGVEVLAT